MLFGTLYLCKMWIIFVGHEDQLNMSVERFIVNRDLRHGVRVFKLVQVSAQIQ